MTYVRFRELERAHDEINATVEEANSFISMISMRPEPQKKASFLEFRAITTRTGAHASFEAVEWLGYLEKNYRARRGSPGAAWVRAALQMVRQSHEMASSKQKAEELLITDTDPYI